MGRLGTRTGMLAGLSNDLFGEQLISALRESRVDTSHVMVSGRPTTLAFVNLEGGQGSYCFFDENSAGRQLGPDDLTVLSPSEAQSRCGCGRQCRRESGCRPLP
ncbi:PfkB family carbohydrate kinase [Rhizobium favelukesii]|uniref:PfkB family carbohydrate kinase n=1 Tax=Rhizobium favelukesii TaxID=348824 RepID=UPI001FD9A9E8|nr:PfkB family carbohydrate kinase [Rhizobium favelukesii]